MTRILAADIGGTKTHVALFEARGADVTVVRDERLLNRDFPDLASLLGRFSDGASCRGGRAAVGLAGPVDGRRAQLTNLPWVVDAEALEAALGLKHVLLLNDLEATAWSLPWLSDDQVETVVDGPTDPRGPAAVVAAGTGLGQAGLVWHGPTPVPFATEGGHATFSPNDDQQRRLAAFLGERHGHVSWERVVSGMALPDLAAFVFAEAGVSLDRFVEASGETSPAAAVTEDARRHPEGLSAEVVRLFVRCYGSVCGNVALSFLTRGGLYLAGGIAPRIRWALDGPDFREAFLAKGRMRHILESIPVRLIADPMAPVIGAAHAAVSSFR
jgi:glucokinase